MMACYQYSGRGGEVEVKHLPVGGNPFTRFTSLEYLGYAAL